ncbi:hypothetical protein ACHAXT_012380 [Thalassiosira profunda]
MIVDESTHQEPFLINAAAEAVSVPRDEVKDDDPDQPLASTERRGSTLRRRFRRRPPPMSEPEPESNREESKYDIESAESQHSEEKKDDEEVGTPSKSPRLPEPLALAPVDDAPANEAEQRKTNPLFSLRASLPSMMMRRDQAAEEKKTPPRPPFKASLPVMMPKDAEEKKTPPRPSFAVSQPTMLHSTSYIRQPDEKLRDKLKTRLRSVADGIPEVHFIGEVSEGVGFKDSFVSCKWSLEWGKSWSFLAGDESSQTQYSAQDDDGVQVWNHPLDAHFAAASIQGWPRIILQVWELDEYGRSILSGYGFAHLPTNPGCHELEVRCWRPSGSMREELESFFLGTSSCLVDENVIFGKAWEDRSSLVTVSSGIVRMHVNVLLRFFGEQRVS